MALMLRLFVLLCTAIVHGNKGKEKVNNVPGPIDYTSAAQREHMQRMFQYEVSLIWLLQAREEWLPLCINTNSEICCDYLYRPAVAAEFGRVFKQYGLSMSLSNVRLSSYFATESNPKDILIEGEPFLGIEFQCRLEFKFDQEPFTRQVQFQARHEMGCVPDHTVNVRYRPAGHRYPSTDLIGFCSPEDVNMEEPIDSSDDDQFSTPRNYVIGSTSVGQIGRVEDAEGAGEEGGRPIRTLARRPSVQFRATCFDVMDLFGAIVKNIPKGPGGM